VSTQIGKLEEHAGNALFEQFGKKIYLTAAGAELLAIAPGYALDNLVYFLIVVAVGGMGSIRGPFVAALILGVADTAFKYAAPELGAFFIYALTMGLLLWRPRGIFGPA